MTEHLSHVEVERTYAVALLKAEVCIAGCLTNNIHRSALALCNLLNVLYVLFLNKQAHAFLTLIGDNLLRRKSLVADRKLGHVNLTTALLDEFRQTVNVSGRTVVVNRNNRIYILLAESTDKVVGTLLHLWVGTLNGVQLNAA